ncbi:MAG: hypothetical protein ACXW1P_03505 [Methylophilaceae bacterium]
MDKSGHCKEVYARFGHAMYRAQCVEQAIVQLIVFTEFFGKNVPVKMSQDEWTKAFDEFDGVLSVKTMGQLVKNLKSVAAIESSIEDELNNALKKRNWLAHHFFVDHALSFVSAEGRERMIGDTLAATEIFDKVEERLTPITYTLAEKYGLSQDVLKATEREMFAKANGDLPPP